MSDKHQSIRKGTKPTSPLRLQAITLDDQFWSPRYMVWREETIQDVLNKFVKAGALENFDRAAQHLSGGHAGPPWHDGLLYETIRAASDMLAQQWDASLDARLDGIIERIAAAQEAVGDGYINTTVTLTYPEQRWGEMGGDQIWNHEEYNAGCLVEAGVHHYLATGKTSLLRLAMRFADYLCAVIGPAPRRNIVPSHPLAEEAVIKLYRLLMDNPKLVEPENMVQPRAYLELVRFWMDSRGNHDGRISFNEYAQDHCALYDQPEAVGHAVRGMLLYAGLAALAAEDGNERDDETLHRLWRDVVQRKMFITGGVGPIKEYEGFGYGYYLPASGYIETCAGVGLAFWASRMHQLYGRAEYFDIYERVVYNNVLAGISLSGNRYSYENPLYSQGSMHRWDWHACPCCPPMLLKLYTEMPGLVLTHDADGIYVNLYAGCQAGVPLAAGEVRVSIETRYPWEGLVRLVVNEVNRASFRINLRLPAWCRDYTLAVNGQALPETSLVNGYLYLERVWHVGDRVELQLAMPVERIIAHPFTMGLRGSTAVQRGPVVYCLEGVDNPAIVDPVLPAQPVFTAVYDQDMLGGVVRVETVDTSGRRLVFVPYYSWDNRSPQKKDDWLRVWLPQQDWYALRAERDEGERPAWAGKLYLSLP